MSDLITMMAGAAGYAASQTGGYQISRSLRFNSADSAYLSRTPASAGNRKTWTWSGWVKFSIPSSSWYPLFGAMASTAYIELSTDYKITFRFSSGDSVRTDMVFRDPSAWYHLVFVADTTQATDTNRLKAYVNGVQVSLTPNLTWPSLNEDGGINTTVSHTIGADVGNSTYQNGYMTEIHFVDGQALTPSDFGETDATTGVWKPKAYAGTYGTNGFYLNFSDNTSGTTLGYDYSGNSNNWTTNNFSVTAGAGNDSLVDTPTPYGTDTGAGGEVRGNYCTLNPIKPGSGTISNGNLQVVTPVSQTGFFGAFGTFAIPSSGKWYWEYVATSGGDVCFNGISNEVGTKKVFYYGFNGNKYIDGAAGTAYGSSYDSQTIGVAVDCDSNEITFYRDGVSQGAISYDLSLSTFFPYFADGSSTDGTTQVVNFGQRPFAYTAPSGFKALCTQNLAEGTITTSGTFTGNGSTDGPFVYLNGVPTAMTIDGNAVTFGTHADKLANGFKVRSSSASYNANATSMSYTISTTGAKFKYANAQPNP